MVVVLVVRGWILACSLFLLMAASASSCGSGSLWGCVVVVRAVVVVSK